MGILLYRNDHIINSDLDGMPVMFLDVDGVLAHDLVYCEETTRMVSRFAELAGARIVICSDRARAPAVYDEVVAAGLCPYQVRGRCDPHAAASATASSKANRVIEWLTLAEAGGVTPSRWCVVDDCRSFGLAWQTQSTHVRPAGHLVSRVEMGLAHTYLTGKLPHSTRRELGVHAPHA